MSHTHQRLICASATSDNADHAAHGALDHLLRTARQLHSRLALIWVMTDDCNVVAARPAQCTSIANLLLYVRDDCTFWHRAEREHIADSEICVLSCVDELAGVHALVCDEGLGAELEVVWIAEGDFGEWCASTWIVDDLLYDTADVAMSLSVVVCSEFCGCL